MRIRDLDPEAWHQVGRDLSSIADELVEEDGTGTWESNRFAECAYEALNRAAIYALLCAALGPRKRIRGDAG